MKLEGCIALVTGANRGLGKAYAEALLAAGAAKVYGAARDPASVTDKRVTPVRLDVTSPKDIAATAQQCSDATLVINNAGAMLASHMLSEGSAVALRREMEVNVFGVLEVSRAFAPVLAKNGGGAIANVLSVVSWFVNPLNATYCVSKHAALAVTDGLRMELKGQGTHVLGVFAGYIDTDMAAGLDVPKATPQKVAEATLEGLRANHDQVYATESVHQLRHALQTDPTAFAKSLQQSWDKQASASAKAN